VDSYSCKGERNVGCALEADSDGEDACDADENACKPMFRHDPEAERKQQDDLHIVMVDPVWHELDYGKQGGDRRSANLRQAWLLPKDLPDQPHGQPRICDEPEQWNDKTSYLERRILSKSGLE